MAKRLREFKRLSFTAKTGVLLQSCLVDKTFDDHYGTDKCIDKSKPCAHEENGNLGIARLIESAIKIGTKRATLDIPDPYCTPDYEVTIRLLKQTAQRVRDFSGLQSMKNQQKSSFLRIAQEVQDYAERNPLVVLADIAAEEN